MLNRCAARTVIARETAAGLADHDPPVLASRIGQRVAFAETARTGRLVFDIDDRSVARRARSSRWRPKSIGWCDERAAIQPRLRIAPR